MVLLNLDSTRRVCEGFLPFHDFEVDRPGDLSYELTGLFN